MIYRIVFSVVKLFFAKLKVVASEKIKSPAVFVCNHLGPFGPLAMMLYFPTLIRPWVSYRTTEKGLAAKEIAENLFKKDSGVPEWIRKTFGKILEYPALWVMKALNAIPVFFDAVQLFRTYNESMKALKSGVSIVVFADKGGEHIDESVGEGIQKGCLYLGYLYGRSCEKPLLFYPVHISRKRHEIMVGEPVSYIKTDNTKADIKRMEDYLSRAIQDMGTRKREKVKSK